MKKILKFICAIVLLFQITSCGFIETESQAIGIESITTIEEAGVNKMVITYTDPERTPDIFVLPTGATGNGIKDLIVKENEDNTGKIVTITYTTDDLEPTVFEIKDAVSVVGIESEDGTDGIKILYVKLSDGTRSEGIPIPPGKDGISVVGITHVVNEDKSATLTFQMSEGDPTILNIPAPEKGNGIVSIQAGPNGDKFEMIITYTDSEPQTITFDRPNKWFSEASMPQSTDGIDGDLWYDYSHNIIYVKERGNWNQVLRLDGNEEERHTVTFDLNDSLENQAQVPAGIKLIATIKHGYNFYSSDYVIPNPIRSGYEFAGWYTTKTPTAINGAFTDLTSVMSDMTLYAKWVAIV